MHCVWYMKRYRFLHSCVGTSLTPTQTPLLPLCPDSTQAIALSQVCVASGSSVTTLFNFFRSVQDDPTLPSINYLVSLVVSPMLFSGESVGECTNRVRVSRIKERVHLLLHYVLPKYTNQTLSTRIGMKWLDLCPFTIGAWRVVSISAC